MVASTIARWQSKLALRYPVFDNIEATHGNSSTNLCSIASLGSNMLNAFGSISQWKINAWWANDLECLGYLGSQESKNITSYELSELLNGCGKKLGSLKYVCVCIYIYSYTYTRIHIYMYTHICIFMPICIFLYMHIYICAYLYIYVCIFVYKYIYTYVYIYIDIIYIYMYIIYIYVHTTPSVWIRRNCTASMT